MIRLRSTHDDHLASLSPRTTRQPATIEAAARARHSLDDVARRAGINLYRTTEERCAAREERRTTAPSVPPSEMEQTDGQL
jgi:hypothetical protein